MSASPPANLDRSGGGGAPNGNIDTAVRRLEQEAKEAMSFGQRCARDVTEEFAAVAGQLKPGQLVKDEYFTLFEAVGALEIMDPKMDSGYVPANDSFNADFDVCRGLEATEVLWIMDELLCLEIAWHEGYPLSQTIFTSLHVDRLLSPDNRPPYTFPYGDSPGPNLTVQHQLVHKVLRAYCVALVKSIQASLLIIQSQNFYEEEDFVTHLFGRDLLEKIQPGQAAEALEDALKCVMSAHLPSEISDALESRLWFRRNYLAVLLAETNEWSGLTAQIEKVNKSHLLVKPIPEAFSEKVQRQLATSTPPRPQLQMSWQGAVESWTRLLSDVAEADRLTMFWVCQSPHCLQRAMWAFAYREPQPGTFARAYLQDKLFGSDRVTEDMSHFDLLLADLRDLVLAGDQLAALESFQVEVPSDPRHLCSRHIESFMDRAFEEYLNIYRMVCQNRCRIRRTFTQAIPILDSLETIAMQTDEEIHRITPQKTLTSAKGTADRLNPLTNWTQYYKIFTMARSIQLGFETEIYLPEELCTMHWLLNVFCQSQCDRLEHIERFLFDRMKTLTQARDSRYVVETLASQDWIKSLRHLWETNRLLSLALYRFYGMLMASGVIRPPTRDYANEQLLWDARMKSYLTIVNDPIPSLQEFKRASSEIKDLNSTCADVNNNIKQARQHLAEMKQMTPQQAKFVGTEEQWKREMKQLETTCVATAVQTSQLLKLAEKRGGEEAANADGGLNHLIEAVIPDPSKRYHLWWVVPILKERK
ncbi:Mak10-domain-containing protein [Hortaea werneckii]|nr:Mak10-domain-containing protein [Hortaea werneckii]KAI7368865.1 Mak10-domain-containing protein [Hortaea werneckii]KAI7470581.1 Mak10-domain-containing protein [Hortaea werneckii]